MELAHLPCHGNTLNWTVYTFLFFSFFFFNFFPFRPVWSSSEGPVGMDSHGTARTLLQYLRICYPIFIFAVFVGTFVANSILAAKNVNRNSNSVCTGPGGRPLPKRSRSTTAVAKQPQKFSENTKLLFKWLSVGVVLTFVADTVINITHVILSKSQHWWPGQSLVVSDN